MTDSNKLAEHFPHSLIVVKFAVSSWLSKRAREAVSLARCSSVRPASVQCEELEDAENDGKLAQKRGRRIHGD